MLSQLMPINVKAPANYRLQGLCDVFCCPRRIRTSTNRTKICRPTLRRSGNPELRVQRYVDFGVFVKQTIEKCSLLAYIAAESTDFKQYS